MWTFLYVLGISSGFLGNLAAATTALEPVGMIPLNNFTQGNFEVDMGTPWQHLPSYLNPVCHLCLFHSGNSYVVEWTGTSLVGHCVPDSNFELWPCDYAVHVFCPTPVGIVQCSGPFTLIQKRLYTMECDSTVDEDQKFSLEEGVLCPGAKVQNRTMHVGGDKAKRQSDLRVEIQEPRNRTMEEYIQTDECYADCMGCVGEGKIFYLDEDDEVAGCRKARDLGQETWSKGRKWIACSLEGCDPAVLGKIAGVESVKCLIKYSDLNGFVGVMRRAGYPTSLLAGWINQRVREQAKETREELVNATTVLSGFWDLLLRGI